MKKLLLATSALVMTSGFAVAEVTLSGDARMGIIDDFGATGPVFSSRARVKFTLSGESDAGFSFGASFRADNAGPASSGTAGSVFISGAFGKLSMGDVDGAANAAVGHVDGVGYTGLSDLNESTFIGGGAKESVLYEYSTGDFTVYASSGQLETLDDTYSIAAKYSAGNFTVALGYENFQGVGLAGVGADDVDHIILGVDGTFGDVTLKARYGTADGTVDAAAFEGDQWALSATYSANGLGVTAFYADDSEALGAEAYGLGASYDLGGNAKVVGGYVKNKTADTSAVDLGLTFSF
jgi:outer membrane protein OmpU